MTTPIDRPQDSSVHVAEPSATEADQTLRVRSPEHLRQDRPSPDVTLRAGRGDQITWGPVWAGAVVALATFLLLQMAFLALGWLTLGDDTSTSTVLMSGLAGLVGLLLGGMTAGATSRHRGARSGLLQGITTWGLVVSSMTVLTLLGGGALFGSFTNALTLVSAITAAASQGVDVSTTAEAVQNPAANGLLALAVLLAAAATGGLLGAKMWPHKDDDERVIDLG